MSKPKEINLDEFVADVCDTIGSMGVWNHFVEAMTEEKGYTEAEIDDGFEKINKKVGRG